MATMLRRFAIICLTFAIFAIAMTMAVNSQSHRQSFSGLGLNAPCPHPLGLQCKTRS